MANQTIPFKKKNKKPATPSFLSHVWAVGFSVFGRSRSSKNSGIEKNLSGPKVCFRATFDAFGKLLFLKKNRRGKFAQFLKKEFCEMKKWLSVLALAALVAFSMWPTACVHEPFAPVVDPTDTLPDPIDTIPDPVDTIVWTPCSPDSVYFQNQILPILISNCTKSGCHDAFSASDEVVLTDFQNVVATGEIEPFKLDGDFYEAITETDPDKRMPPTGEPQLTAAQKTAIAKWILQGAKNNRCDETNPNTVCDTVAVSYAAAVKPIIDAKCKGCHSGTVPQGNLRLTTHAEVKTASVSGKLIGTIEHRTGFSKMPQGGAKLSDCAIQKIKSWVAAGAKDN